MISFPRLENVFLPNQNKLAQHPLVRYHSLPTGIVNFSSVTIYMLWDLNNQKKKKVSLKQHIQLHLRGEKGMHFKEMDISFFSSFSA